MSRIADLNSPGGRLRGLRERAGRTQLDVELDAELGSGYLQRVEAGKVRHPERETLERILTALGARYADRRDVLDAFGYAVDTPLPTDVEIAAVIAEARPALDGTDFPAYMLDCAHRVVAWNRQAGNTFRLNTLASGQPPYTSMFQVLFDPAHGLARFIRNPDAFFPTVIRALRYERALVGSEVWYPPLIAELRERLPLFRHYWDADPENAVATSARTLTPLELAAPDGSLLRLRLTSEPFALDRRFRLILYLPDV